MPRSSTSEESDSQTLLSHETIDLGFDEKAQQNVSYPSRLCRFMRRLDTKRRVAVGLLTTTTILGALAFTVLALSHSSNKTPENNCGTTTEEALALGCVFDAINYSWQPSECFHQEIYNRYWDIAKAQGALKWYADSDFTEELPQDIEVLMHTPYVWSEHQLHVLHCLYDWELMHYALQMNKPAPKFISLLNHTMHCADTALDQDYRIKDTSIKASHNGCVMLA